MIHWQWYLDVLYNGTNALYITLGMEVWRLNHKLMLSILIGFLAFWVLYSFWLCHYTQYSLPGTMEFFFFFCRNCLFSVGENGGHIIRKNSDIYLEPWNHNKSNLANISTHVLSYNCNGPATLNLTKQQNLFSVYSYFPSSWQLLGGLFFFFTHLFSFSFVTLSCPGMQSEELDTMLCRTDFALTREF